MGLTTFIAFNDDPLVNTWAYIPEGALGHLDDLLDVDATTPNNGDTIVFNSITSNWENAPGGGLGPLPSGTVTAETSLGGAASNAGVAATFSRGDHTHGTPAMPALDDLSDVAAGAPAGGDVLTFVTPANTWQAVAPAVVPSPSATVTAETSLSGAASNAGMASDYSRGDHTHGTPAMPALDDLSDVSAGAPAGGDVLTFVTPANTWQAVAIPAPSLALDDLTDVDAAAPNDGDVLTYDNGTGDWIAAAPVPGGLTHQQVMARIWIQV